MSQTVRILKTLAKCYVIGKPLVKPVAKEISSACGPIVDTWRNNQPPEGDMYAAEYHKKLQSAKTRLGSCAKTHNATKAALVLAEVAYANLLSLEECSRCHRVTTLGEHGLCHECTI